MRNGHFTMYDDDGFQVAAPSARNTSGPTAYHPARFPTKNISTPVVLMYGDEDSLIEIDSMLNELPEGTTYVKRLRVSHLVSPLYVAHEFAQGYEHLDILWGKDIDRDVIPVVLQTLAHYCGNNDVSDRVSQGDWMGADDGTSTMVSTEY
jgi:lysosomal acid lipase/cholesteryl ester hydrolase